MLTNRVPASAASIARRRAARQAIRKIRELLRSATTTEDDMLDTSDHRLWLQRNASA